MTTSFVNPQEQSPPTIPKDLRLRDILNTLPREVFEKDPRKAWFKLVINITIVGFCYWAIAVSPWFLLPFVWVLTGTALTGLFVIGHDCGHRSFSNRLWVNDLVGHVVFIPLNYPFHAWRIGHNYHHKHTNKHGVDNTWDPFDQETYDNAPPIISWGYRHMRGKFWWLGSIAHWALVHFRWWKFEGKEREQVRFSVLVVIATSAIGFPALIATTGLIGLVKFWLMPWIGYHFWMSTFTMVHHTLPDIPFKTTENWHEAEAQLAGTVHCDYPWWVEFLCHDINVHIPHHISTAIPWYNLRKAHQSIKENWGEHVVERKFNLALVKEITDNCHLYDEPYYQTFQEHQLSKSN